MGCPCVTGEACPARREKRGSGAVSGLAGAPDPRAGRGRAGPGLGRGWAVAPSGPRGCARAGRAPPSGLAVSSAPDTPAVSGEQDQPGGPGRERTGRLYGSQGHAPQGRESASPAGSFPELGLLQGPVQGHERPAARGRPGGYARPSAAFPTEDTVARWQCGQLASVLRGHRLGPAVLGVRKAFASLRAWWGGRGPGSHRAARVRRCQDSRGAEETWGPLPAAAHAPRAQHGRPRGWRWAGGTRCILTSCPSPCRREPTSTSP